MSSQEPAAASAERAAGKRGGQGLAVDAEEQVVKAIRAIEEGPRALRTYMEICARCGTCATVCPVYYGSSETKHNPVLRSDLIRGVYWRHCTTAGRVLGSLARARDFRASELEQWAEAFWACTECRRCAMFCPFGIDNSVITQKGRGILDQLGLTPETIQRVVRSSLETGNSEGLSPAAFRAAIQAAEDRMKNEHGVDVRIPVDMVGAEYFYVPPLEDVLVSIEATTGIAKIFHVLGMAESWTMSSTCFDGANYGLFNGNDADMKAENERYVKEAKRLGAKVMLMGECGHAYRIMKMIMEPAGWWGKLPFEIVNCVRWTAGLIEEGKLEFDRSRNPDAVTYHDPCNLGRSCGIYREARVILEATCEEFREMTPSGPENWCCGGGGGLSALDEILEFRMNVSGKKKLEQIRATGAEYVAAPCSDCKRQLGQLMERHEPGIAVGGVHDVVSRSIRLDGKAAERGEAGSPMRARDGRR